MGTQFTYDQVGRREGLSEQLAYISPTRSPLYSAFPKKKIKSTYHEWQTQALPSATTNAAIEGAAWSAGTITNRTRTGNYTQILRKCYTITRTAQAVDVAGIKDEYAEQKKLAQQNLVRDIEYAILNATGNSGTTAAARELKGVRGWISTTNITGTGSGSETLTEDMLNDCAQSIKDNNGDPGNVYVTGTKKREISAFYGNSKTVVNQQPGTIVNAVDVYVTDFGPINIYYHDLATSTEVLMLDMKGWAVGVLDETGPDEVLNGAMDGNTFGMAIELTLESKNEAWSGKITQLS